jgi:hypothetical protein
MAALLGNTRSIAYHDTSRLGAHPAQDSLITSSGIQYFPDSIIITEDEIVYLLDNELSSLFRWSVPERKDLSTISLQNSPALMAYSPETNRIYLNYYGEPQITQIILNQTPLREIPFITPPLEVHELENVGGYIFTKDNENHSTYSPEGELISRIPADPYFQNAKWDLVNRRMYLFNGLSIPNKIFWEEISPDGGFGPIVETKDVDSGVLGFPVHIKPDGTQIFFGSVTNSSNIIETTNYDQVALFDYTSKDGAWKSNDFYLLNKQTNQINGTEVQKLETVSYQPVINNLIKGIPIRIFPISEGLLVITHYEGYPWFYILNDQLEILYETIYYDTYIPLVLNKNCNGFFDDFSTPLSGWTVGEDDYVRSEYLDGEFRILSKNDSYMYLYAAPSCAIPEYFNYTVELDAKWVGEPGFSYGILYEISPEFDHYNLLLINTDYQEFGIYQINMDNFTPIVPFEYSPVIKSGGETNHLKIFQDFGSFTHVDINGKSAWSGSSGLYVSAYVGIVTIPYDDYPISDARFDNFRLVFPVDNTYASLPEGVHLLPSCDTANNHQKLGEIKVDLSALVNLLNQ